MRKFARRNENLSKNDYDLPVKEAEFVCQHKSVKEKNQPVSEEKIKLSRKARWKPAPQLAIRDVSAIFQISLSSFIFITFFVLISVICILIIETFNPIVSLKIFFIGSVKIFWVE